MLRAVSSIKTVVAKKGKQDEETHKTEKASMDGGLVFDVNYYRRPKEVRSRSSHLILFVGLHREFFYYLYCQGEP
jgi:hypothetical protein